jgi:hypothetical protein
MGAYRTRIAGACAAALEVSLLALGAGNALVHSLLATLGAALAMIGPGACRWPRRFPDGGASTFRGDRGL